MSYVASASAVECVYYGSQAGGGFPGHPGPASHVRQSLFILYVVLPGGKIGLAACGVGVQRWWRVLNQQNSLPVLHALRQSSLLV